MKHKDILFPDVDLSHDEGDPRWHEAGGKEFTPEYKKDGAIRSYIWTGLAPGFWREYWELCIIEQWAETVLRYEWNPDDVYCAWWYIDTHPVFWAFGKDRDEYPKNHVARLKHEGALQEGWPYIAPHKVNPDKGRHGRVSHNEKKNTQLQWWFEFGPSVLNGGCKTHDWELDGGAATYEQCVIKIAKRIHRYYGNDRTLVDSGDEYWLNRKLRGRAGKIQKKKIREDLKAEDDDVKQE